MTPRTVARQAFLSITNSWSLLQLMSIELEIPSNHLVLCHPLSSPSLPVFNLSQNQGLFQSVSFSHQVAKVLASASASVLPKNIQDWFSSGLTGLISLKSKGLSRVFSNMTIQKHQFFSTQLSLGLTSIYDYWENQGCDILKMLSIPTHEHRVFLHFFRSFSISFIRVL